MKRYHVLNNCSDARSNWHFSRGVLTRSWGGGAMLPLPIVTTFRIFLESSALLISEFYTKTLRVDFNPSR